MTDLGTWDSLGPGEVADLFAGFDRPWWIAGGWAIDLAVGTTTREHDDIDVAVLRSDQLAVQAHLRGWELSLANVTLTPWIPGELAPAETCDVWCRPAGATAWALQLMLDPSTPATWVCRRNTMLTRPMSEAVLRSDDDARLPYLAPELQLLMKAKRREAKDDADFATALGILDDDARSWLRSALERTHPGHGWLDELA